jgi:hypothetical protein
MEEPRIMDHEASGRRGVWVMVVLSVATASAVAILALVAGRARLDDQSPVTSASVATLDSSVPSGGAEAPGHVQSDATPTWIDDLPLLYPEREVYGSPIVASVRVVELYPLRANSESGVVPTRDPDLPPGRDAATPEKRLFQPVRLEVLDLYKPVGPGATLDGAVAYVYAGIAADRDGLPAGVHPGYAVDPSSLQVGDTAMAFLFPIDSTRWPIDAYVTALADDLAAGDGGTFVAATVAEWYSYSGETGASLKRGSLSIAELEQRVATAVAAQGR